MAMLKSFQEEGKLPWMQLFLRVSPNPDLELSAGKCSNCELVVHLKLNVLFPLNFEFIEELFPQTQVFFYPIWELFKRVWVGFLHGEVMERT